MTKETDRKLYYVIQRLQPEGWGRYHFAYKSRRDATLALNEADAGTYRIVRRVIIDVQVGRERKVK